MSLDQPNGFVKQQSVTTDAFLGGRLVVSQPRNGFRSGLDGVLLGAAVRAGARSLLDLGAGVGGAALVALALNGELHARLAEIDPATLALARDNLRANGMDGRADAVLCDVTAKGVDRQSLGTDAYDSVIANPPYFARGAGTTGVEPGRVRARHMEAAALDTWVRTAAASAAPGGEAIFVHRAEALAALLASFSSRFGQITVLPLVPRPGTAATRLLIRGIKGSRAPLTLLSPLVLHGTHAHAFAPLAEAIFRGEARLDW